MRQDGNGLRADLWKDGLDDAFRPDQQLYQGGADEGIQPGPDQAGREAAPEGLAKIQVVLDDWRLCEGSSDGACDAE